MKRKVYVCHRKKCKFYEEKLSNHCMALSTAYRNNKECAFFKEGTEGRKVK